MKYFEIWSSLIFTDVLPISPFKMGRKFGKIFNITEGSEKNV